MSDPFTITVSGGDAKARTILTATIAQVLNAIGCTAHLSDPNVKDEADLATAAAAARGGALRGELAQVASVDDAALGLASELMGGG